MPEQPRVPIKSLLLEQWPGEWGIDPPVDSSTALVYRSTDLDDFGHVLEEGGAERDVAPARLRSKTLRSGDLLLEASGGGPGKPVGRVGLFTAQQGRVSTCSNFLRALRPNSVVVPSYLRWALHAMHASPEIWRFQQQTTGMSNLKVADYLEHCIPLPSRQEQVRIATVLDSLDHAIASTESLIAKTQQIKAGLMQDLFTRGVGADSTLRPSHQKSPDLYAKSALGPLPANWRVVVLGNVSEIASGVTLGPASPKSGVEVPYLRVANVQDGYLDLAEVKTIRVRPDRLPSLLLRRGDVLMNEGGDFDKLGRGTVWREEISPCIHQNHVFRVRPKPEVLLSEYLAYWSQSERGRQFFLLSSKQSTNLASINSSQLHRFPVALPDLHEQRLICGRLRAVDLQIAALDDHAVCYRSVRRGLMRDLLSGCASAPAKQDRMAVASV